MKNSVDTDQTPRSAASDQGLIRASCPTTQVTFFSQGNMNRNIRKRSVCNSEDQDRPEESHRLISILYLRRRIFVIPTDL